MIFLWRGFVIFLWRSFVIFLLRGSMSLFMEKLRDFLCVERLHDFSCSLGFGDLFL